MEYIEKDDVIQIKIDCRMFELQLKHLNHTVFMHLLDASCAFTIDFQMVKCTAGVTMDTVS